MLQTFGILSTAKYALSCNPRKAVASRQNRYENKQLRSINRPQQNRCETEKSIHAGR